MDLGLERAGMVCKWQVEIDPYARRVLAKHWPDVRRHDDVRTFPPDDGTDWKVDLIAGGFPCQDISFAGKGAGLSGKRSGLWYEFARIIGVLRPEFVLVENVAALLKRGLGDVLGTLASLGYDAEWSSVSACEMGAPHMRQRMFLVCYPACRDDISIRGKPHKTKKEGWVSQLMRGHWWDAEPEICRVVDGLSRPMDCHRGLGNAVVPQVAQFIGERIIAYLKE
jgi:DNA (cytosine-5)-methyltransferase 1